MSTPKAFLKALSIIKVGFITRTRVVEVVETPLTSQLIWLLFSRGYFVNIVRHNKKLQITLRFFQNKPVLQNLQVLYSGSRPRRVSAFQLKRYYRSQTLIVSTSYGLLFRSECVARGIGGILLVRLH